MFDSVQRESWEPEGLSSSPLTDYVTENGDDTSHSYKNK